MANAQSACHDKPPESAYRNRQRMNNTPNQPATPATLGGDSMHKQLGLEDDSVGIRLKTTLDDGTSRLGGIYLATAANLIDLTQSAAVLKRSARHAHVSLVDEDERQIDLPEIVQDQIRLRSIGNDNGNGPWMDATPPSYADIRDQISAAAANKAAGKAGFGADELLVLEHKVTLRIAQTEHVLHYIDKSSVPVTKSKGSHFIQDLGFKSRDKLDAQMSKNMPGPSFRGV